MTTNKEGETEKDTNASHTGGSGSALLSSHLSHDIMAQNIVSFLHRTTVLELMKVEPIRDRFRLPEHYCMEHGTRLEKRQKEDDDTEDTPSKEEELPALTCIDCEEAKQDRYRCDECDIFSEDVSFCDCCKKTRCDACAKYYAWNRCKECNKSFCGYDGCPKVVEYCEECWCYQSCSSCGGLNQCRDCWEPLCNECSIPCDNCAEPLSCYHDGRCEYCSAFFCRYYDGCPKLYSCCNCEELSCSHCDPNVACPQCGRKLCQKCAQDGWCYDCLYKRQSDHHVDMWQQQRSARKELTLWQLQQPTGS